jgi:hypothetical protein
VRLSDLLTYTVVGTDGRTLGQVSDIRVVQDGPVVATQASFRVDAVLVGKGGLAERLGYVRNRVQGPWLLRVVFSALERRAWIIETGQIASWDHEQRRLRLRAGATPRHAT